MLTVGGIYGIVHEIDEEDDLIVEIAEGIRVRVARRAVAGVVKPEDEAATRHERSTRTSAGGARGRSMKMVLSTPRKS